MADRLKLEKTVIVEGRDDTSNLKRAVDCYTIETHGFGISRQTWQEIEKAYRGRGIMIFTDPDHSGEEIRRRITAKYPDAVQVHLTREEALKDGDIGVENASCEALIRAFEKALALEDQASSQLGKLTEGDLFERGLAGAPGSGRLREKLAGELGIGYGNSKSFLNKLNAFGIGKEELDGALLRISEE